MKRTLLAIDLVAQGLMLAAALILAPTIFYPLLIAIPLGAWQLSSALAKGLALPSELHLNYFLAASAYLFLLYLGARIIPALEPVLFYPDGAGKVWMAVAAAPPLFGAFWYFHRTYQDYTACAENPESV